MDVQEAVAESQTVANAEDNGDSRRDAQRKFTMGPNDSLEGKLVYDGSVHVDGRAEGEFRVTGNLYVASGAMAKISIDAANVTVKGTVEGALEVTGSVEIDEGGTVTGPVTARDRLIVGRAGTLKGDVRIARLVIQDGATFSGNVSMGKAAVAPPKAVETTPEPEPIDAPKPVKALEAIKPPAPIKLPPPGKQSGTKPKRR